MFEKTTGAVILLREPAVVTHLEKPIETQGILVDAPKKQKPVDPNQFQMEVI
jgi:hypothetical protein